jgi:hypothetical protein
MRWFTKTLLIFPFAVAICLKSSVISANPYHDPKSVPEDPPSLAKTAKMFQAIPVDISERRTTKSDVIRIDVDWVQSSDSFQLRTARRESSGTDYLHLKSHTPPVHGSYIGILEDQTGQKHYASLGTGQEFRKLIRGLTFRFPAITTPATFTLIAEDPSTGEMQENFTTTIQAQDLDSVADEKNLDVRLIKAATASPAIQVVTYAEGYKENRKEKFLEAARKVAASFLDSNLPTYPNMEITAVFAPSKEALGNAQNLGQPVPERDSFLGLYYPYWNNFGRWYHVIYPTRYQKYRNALAQVPYDYPIVVVDSSAYWGVGNYMELTAIPAESSSFRYLLLHEFGHFLGLNEEYEGGGRTELAFAPGISEPWSQNITFNPSRESLKWKNLVQDSTPLPTPRSTWNSTQNGPLGAYQGGYADSATGRSYKPGYACIMERHTQYCSICRQGIIDEFQRAMDLK